MVQQSSADRSFGIDTEFRLEWKEVEQNECQTIRFNKKKSLQDFARIILAETLGTEGNKTHIFLKLEVDFNIKFNIAGHIDRSKMCYSFNHLNIGLLGLNLIWIVDAERLFVLLLFSL
jgi:6-phosphofructokinase